MSILVPVVSRGITLSEVPDRIAVFFEIGCCHNGCKGCHSPHLQTNKVPFITLEEMVEYANKRVDEGANAIVLMGGTTNGLDMRELYEIINALSFVAPVCLYSGLDSSMEEACELVKNAYLSWLKIGSYKESLGGLQSPTTNQRFFKCDFDITYSFRDGVKCTPALIDITKSFQRKGDNFV